MLAVTTYLAVKAVHFKAVPFVAAFGPRGLPMAYPLLLPYVRRNHPHAMPGVHDVQHWLNIRLTGPGTGLALLFGAYRGAKHNLWCEVWVDVPIAISATIAGVGGYVVKATGRMSELSRVD